MSVEVVVPFGGQCKYRQEALRWIRNWYAECHPQWEVSIAESQSGGGWCKGHAVSEAVKSGGSEIVIVADADCVTDGLPAAVEAVEGGAPWAIPHKGVYRLTEQGTTNFYDGLPWHEQPLTQPAYRGYPGGGFVVMAREVMNLVPPDPRFVGWG